MTTLPVLQTYEKDQTKINFTINQIARALNDNSTFIYAKAAGIVGDGVIDDTTAIQNAINALPPSGGTILFDAGMNCKITRTLKLGDGTSSTFSTKAGIRLVGMGIPPGAGPNLSFPSLNTVKFTWAGPTNAPYTANSAMLQILGPLQGWGIDNILFDGASLATVGVDVISAMFGACTNFHFLNCTWAIACDTWVASGAIGIAAQANCWHNNFRSTSIVLPAIAGARGLFLSNARGAISGYTANNSCYNKFDGLAIGAPAAACDCIYLMDCDTNTIRDVQLWGGGVAAVNAVTLNFNGNGGGVWPNSDLIDHIDPAAATTLGVPNAGMWNVIGTPLGAYKPIYVSHVALGNGGVYPTTQPGFVSDLTKTVGTVSRLSAVPAASFGTTTIISPSLSGLYRIAWELSIAAAGTAGTVSLTLTWSNGATITFTSGTLSLTAAGSLSGTSNAFVVAATNITYATTVAGVTGNPQYRLSILIERIGY